MIKCCETRTAISACQTLIVPLAGKGNRAFGQITISVNIVHKLLECVLDMVTLLDALAENKKY